MSVTFADKRPAEWQKIRVFDIDDDFEGTVGYYRFSDHHTYPHDVHKRPMIYASRFESYTDGAEWEPVYE